jgi:hypothetical protein
MDLVAGKRREPLRTSSVYTLRPVPQPEVRAPSYVSRAGRSGGITHDNRAFGRLITLWTVAGMDNAFAFIRGLFAAGIAVAIGHTEASMEVIDGGRSRARVCTHLQTLPAPRFHLPVTAGRSKSA